MDARRILSVLLLTTALCASGSAVGADESPFRAPADLRLDGDPAAGGGVLLAIALPRAFPVSVIEGPAGSIGAERIALRKRFLGAQAIERFLLDLTLEELRTNGTEVFLGAQRVALTDTTFVAEGEPTQSFALVDVDWTTPPMELLSNGRACLQLFRIRSDGTLEPRGELESRELTPSLPL